MLRRADRGTDDDHRVDGRGYSSSTEARTPRHVSAASTANDRVTVDDGAVKATARQVLAAS